MNKICTTIEQSEKLIELGIDVNTADMYWWATSLRYYIEAMNDGDFNEREGHIPAWSLPALLKLIPIINGRTYTMCGTLDGGAIISHEGVTCVAYQADDTLDAVFEMVVYLIDKGTIKTNQH